MDTRISGHWLLLRAGRLRLIVPQAEVGAAEYLECAPQAGAHPGLFEMTVAGEQVGVIFPSERLQPLVEAPTARYVLTRLNAWGGDGLWVAWDEVRVLQFDGVPVHRLPAAAQADDTAPANRYVELGGDVVLCSAAERIAAFLHAGLGESA